MIKWMVLSGLDMDEIKASLYEILYNDDLNNLYTDYIKSLGSNSKLNTSEIKDQIYNKITEIENISAAEATFKMLLPGYFEPLLSLSDYSPDNDYINEVISNSAQKLGVSENDIKEFFDKNSINGSTEIDNWQTIVDMYDNATDAMERYLELYGKKIIW